MSYDDDGATLGVGFKVDTGGSFTELAQLEKAMASAEGKLLASGGRIEKATAGMVSLGGATAQVTTFAHSADKTGAAAERSFRQIERSGEAMVRSLERQNAVYGLSREEVRRLRAEEAAAAAAKAGNHDLAARIRAQEAALADQELAAARRVRFEAEAAAQAQEAAAAATAAAKAQEAQALRDAAFAHQMFEARVREGVQAMRDKQAAEAEAARQTAALAASADRFRASISPAFAAQGRFNAEMAEARRLIAAGAISLDDYVAKLAQQRAALAAASTGQGRFASSATASRMAMQGASYQVQDFVTQVSMGANPINAFAVQGAQLAGQFSMIEGRAGNLARFFMGPWGLAITAAAMLASMFSDKLFGATEAEKAKAKAAKDLASEMAALEKATRSATMSEQANADATLRSAAAARQMALDARAATIEKLQLTRATLAANLAQANRSDGAGDGGRAAAAGSAALAFENTRQLRALDAELALRQSELQRKEVSFREAQVPILRQRVAEQTDAAAAATGRFDRAMDALNRRFGAGRLSQAAYVAEATKLTRQREADEKAIADGKKAETAAERAAAREGRRQERLGRDDNAVEARIRNLGRLADAYDVSGAAALVAEARVGAESAAIKRQADAAAAIAQGVRVAVATRIADAARGTAAMRDQLAVQLGVNEAVAAGLVPAERAADLLRDRMADLPLLQAMEAARTASDVAGAERGARALDDQRVAREKLTAAETAGRLAGVMAGGRDRLADLEAELRLIGATDAARARAMATRRAEREAAANDWTGTDGTGYVAQQLAIHDATERLAAAQASYNGQLTYTAERWDLIARNVDEAGRGMADAFGSAGRAIGDVAATFAGFTAQRERAEAVHRQNLMRAGTDERGIARENALYALANSTRQVAMYGDMTKAARLFFKEGTGGYRAMETAERAFRAVEFAMSVKAMAQDAVETGSSLAKSAARTAGNAVEAVTKAISSLPFPFNIAAGAATIAALGAIGVSVAGGFGGGARAVDPGNTGTGTVFGDPAGKSESIRRGIDQLREVDTLMLGASREMATSLRSIDGQIGGFAALVVRAGRLDAGASDSRSGGILGTLFGSSTTVKASGLFGGPQSVGSVMANGFDASTYADVERSRRFLGLTVGRSSSTQFAGADAALERQFTLILGDFAKAIGAAAGPLGASTDAIAAKVAGFVVDIGKVDLKGLTGAQVQEKLAAVFGAAADGMAGAAFPGIERFQRVGEGAFETLVRVSSTVEAVTDSLTRLGGAARGLGVDAKVALADRFDSVGDFTAAAGRYFETYYSAAEQAAARTAQMTDVFGRMGLALPGTLANFRALVEAQDLTTDAGRATYATLIELAPAFADLRGQMEGARSAADIMAERSDLERKLLELAGDTAALRALDLAKLDASNRGLQQQVWAVQDAMEAARAADELRKAWTDAGGAIMDEVRRIRGLTGEDGGSFAGTLGRFNAATASARAGDQEAARLLPGLSQSLLRLAANQATSRQELDRVSAETAASLEETFAAITRLAAGATPAASAERLMAAMAATAGTGAAPIAANDVAAADEIRALREEVAAMRRDQAAGLAAVAGNTGKVARIMERVTDETGGNAVAVASAA